MNIEKIDKIILEDNDLEKITSWVQKQNFTDVDFPLEEVLITMKESIAGMSINLGIYFISTQDPFSITIKIYDLDTLTIMSQSKFDDDFIKAQSTEAINLPDTTNPLHTIMDNTKLKDINLWALTVVLDIFQYMTNYTDNIIEKKESKLIKRPQRKNKKSRKRTRSTRISTSQYTFNFNPNPRSFTRHTPSWTVRGHWRYIKKTGKKVWISGYKKGDGDPEGKVYKL